MDGTVQLTVACVSPPAALTASGAVGGPVGVTEPDAVEAGPSPAALVAVTVNVYAVPLVRPETVTGLAAEPTGETSGGLG